MRSDIVVELRERTRDPVPGLRGQEPPEVTEPEPELADGAVPLLSPPELPELLELPELPELLELPELPDEELLLLVPDELPDALWPELAWVAAVA
jgi:hypothetical protein